MRKLSAIEHRLIEDEHARLDQLLQDLREACCNFGSVKDCQGCGREKIASCQGRLNSFAYDFLDFVIQHFRNEEKIMAGASRTQDSNEYFRLHQKEHARLLKEMESLMQELLAMSKQGHTAVAIREFHYRVAELFGEHTRTFDDPFISRPHRGKE